MVTYREMAIDLCGLIGDLPGVSIMADCKPIHDFIERAIKAAVRQALAQKKPARKPNRKEPNGIR